MKKINIVKVFAYSMKPLNEYLNEWIEEGYSLYGNINIVVMPPDTMLLGEHDSSGYCYVQFMIKEIEE